MKKIKLWLSGFNLVQQFIAVAILTVFIVIFMAVSVISTRMSVFIDDQIYSYLHHYQQGYLVAEKSTLPYEDNNVESYIFNKTTNTYLNTVNNFYSVVINDIDPNVDTVVDGSKIINNVEYIYSIIPLQDNNFSLLSFASQSYILDYKNSLFDSVINIVFYLIGGLFILFLVWVVSLIRPLNKIRDYIDALKSGEKADLKLQRSDEIGQVGEALIEMNDELAKQQRIREEMVQNISHDLKTPIATIKSYSESIKDGIYPYDTLEKSVDVIIEHANRLEKKAYNLNTFNKLEYLVDSNNETNMAEVVKKAILSAEAIRKEIEIETDLNEDIVFHGEEEPWRTAVENLIDNALRYAKSVVRIKLSDRLLEVFNDGDQMSNDRIDKLFKPYEKGTKGNFGLGLSIVKKVCNTYGYTVIGENMNDGVIFRIYTNKTKTKRSHLKANNTKV